MVTTDDEELADRLRCARLHGMSRDAWRRYEPGGSWRYDVVEAGLKANLPDVAAAVGRAQLRHVDAWQERRTGRRARLPRAAGGRAGPRPAGGTVRRAPRVAPLRRPGQRPVAGRAATSSSTELGPRRRRHVGALHPAPPPDVLPDCCRDCPSPSTARTASSPSSCPSPCTRRSPTTRSTVSARLRAAVGVLVGSPEGHRMTLVNESRRHLGRRREPTSPDEDARGRRGDRRTRTGARPHRRSRVRPAADRVPRRRRDRARPATPAASSGTLDELTEVALRERGRRGRPRHPATRPRRLPGGRGPRRGRRARACATSRRSSPPSSGRSSARDMRWLDVSRLLGRDEIHVVSPAAGAEITDRVVLVTGAGGSIGSELCRQVFGFGPRRLIMLDHDESNLHRLQLELWGEGTARQRRLSWSPTSATASASTTCSARRGPTSCSTRRPTSTCPCWRSTPARR